MVNYTYNLSALDGGNSTADLIVSLNEQAEGLPFIATLILLWLFIFITARGYGRSVSESFTITSFINTIVAALGFFIGFIGWEVVIVPVIMFLAGLAMIGFSK